MPKERGIEKIISAFYKRKAMDLFMFGYVTGVLDMIPAATIKQVILNFLNKYDISEDDFNFETAQQVYFKIRDDFEALSKK